MNHITWDEYFMGVAALSAKRSKDPNTKVGACVVNEDKRIIGIGYNGFPMGCSDQAFPWGKTDDNYLNTKYPYVVHAEPNAILNCTSSLKNSTLYVTLFPCNECAKLIIQSGIKHIVYGDDKYHNEDSFKASRRMFDAAKVTYTKMPKITVDIRSEEA
ncbi:MAG: dCMP deaminase family protein [Anaeroplasmataceae bacterium]|nr:dCMP deaminase family protein [Anaeroplasmataceae bacterium]MDE6414676.1 dCMP deaminase family protein [Anaeroplasmataceae bacterium]